MNTIYDMPPDVWAVAMDPEAAVFSSPCPRCKAAPGEPCLWRQRPSWPPVHAPRLSKHFNAVRREYEVTLRAWRAGYPCHDCGDPTAPNNGATLTGPGEYYAISLELWASATRGSDLAFLCIGCLESRIGRTLVATDFTDVPINRSPDEWRTERLENRLTATDELGGAA